MTTPQDPTVDRLASPAHLRPRYQPIVDLAGGVTTGYEALARWPGLGTTPPQAFATAGRAGRLVELDHACQAAAVRGALDAGLDRSIALFLNGEPSSLAATPSDRFLDLVDTSSGRLRVVMEITERRLLEDPAKLFRAIRRIREWGWGIALDDVGAVPESLAMLPFIAPDVIKLDISLVQQWPTTAQGGIVTAVMAYAERTGATILAEGIETPAHLEQALALYMALARRCPLVSAVGQGLSAEPVPGVFGANLVPDDPLRGEWTVVVVGPHYAGALVARDLGDSGPDRDRRFAFTVTHRRDVVLAAALSIFERIEPRRPPHRPGSRAGPVLPRRLVAPKGWTAPVPAHR